MGNIKVGDDTQVRFGAGSGSGQPGDINLEFVSADSVLAVTDAAGNVLESLAADGTKTLAGLAGTAGLVRNDADGALTGGHGIVKADLPAHNHTDAGEGGDYPWADITGFATGGASTLVARGDKPVDTFGAPTDNTAGNVSTGAHGFMPKIPANSAGYVARINTAGNAIEYGPLTSTPPAVHPFIGSQHSFSGLTGGAMYGIKATTPTTATLSTIVAADVGASASDHTQTVDKGGTGLTIAPTEGQLLVGNTSGGYTLQTIDSDFIGASASDHVQAVDKGGTGLTAAPTEGQIMIGNAEGGYEKRLGTADDFGAQPADDRLDDIAAITPTADTLIGGDGTNLVGVAIADIPLDALGAAIDGSTLIPPLPETPTGKIVGNNGTAPAWVDAGTPGPHDGATAHTSEGVAAGKVPTAQGDGTTAWDYPTLGALSEEDIPVHDVIAHHAATGAAGSVYRLSAEDTPEIGPLQTSDIPDLSATYATAGHVQAPDKGGTGLTSAPANGQIAIGKTDGTFALTTITAGTNVTVTNGDGTITISATGGGGMTPIVWSLNDAQVGTMVFAKGASMYTDGTGKVKRLASNGTADQGAQWTGIVPAVTETAEWTLHGYIQPRASEADKTAVVYVIFQKGGGADFLTDAFDDENAVQIDIPATAGYPVAFEIPIANRDGLVAGDLYRAQVWRKATADGTGGLTDNAGVLDIVGELRVTFAEPEA